ncbi:beta-galactosidase [Parabacteroides sp. OttesenSCG-928-N08]|nr:beta-galactosidase [Parabacteroides sp. OttesenSCG-928-N08]
MKQITLTCLGLFMTLSLFAWEPKGDKIKTKWADEVTPENAWQVYPRPQLQRADWQNLNGLWEYQVTEMVAKKNTVNYGNEILVPFAIESSLSGVAQNFTPTDKLWYRKVFTIDPSWKGKQIILHFGAVDYACQVWVNNKLVGSHIGGNNPFSFDITRYLKGGGAQTVELAVTDPTDTESVTRGKQQLNQQGIWYTPVSGIWQTVWLEPVSKTYIRSILPETNIRNKKVTLNFDIAAMRGNETVKVKVLDGGKEIAAVEQKVASAIEITLSDFVMWSLETPKLYDLEVSLFSGAKELDRVKSYFAMREVTKERDAQGVLRTFINGEPLFQYGPLDQGWWPDGLLTPPSPEAMIWDMIQLKEMGFNTIRKHIKVEPALYYYYADSLGLMIWQDMPSGFATARKEQEHVKHLAEQDWNAPQAHVEQWWTELTEMIDDLRFFPCITTWVVFNEGWGQHNTKEMVEKVMALDKTRIINGVSGWTDRDAGDMYDVHNYPSTAMQLPAITNNRISVLGEFGGLGLPIAGSLWNPNMRNWGYRNIEGGVDLVSDYAHLVFDLETLIAQGLSAAIYTQTTDVEGEINGLITYDRKTTKIPNQFLNIIHSRLYKVKPAKVVDLIEDARTNASLQREVTVEGVTQQVKVPFAVNGEKTIYSKQEFNVDKAYDNLSLYLNVRGEVTVLLNGVEILHQNERLTRSYNQYNVSDYAHYLRKGMNRLEIKIVPNNNNNNNRNPMDFDYGLKAF